LTAIAFARILRGDDSVEGRKMKNLKSAFLLALVMLTAAATQALATQSFDICVNPATDAATQDATAPGGFVTVAANIYAAGTIPKGE
jgi:hypothetical protein